MARGLDRATLWKSWRSIGGFRRLVKRKLAAPPSHKGRNWAACKAGGRRRRLFAPASPVLSADHALMHPLAQVLAATVATVVAFTAPGAAASAGPQDFRGEYTVSFLGLSVAKATFDSHYENDAYSIHGSVSSAGIAQLFDDTKGTISTSGRVLADR